jgi:hypothetical protein
MSDDLQDLIPGVIIRVHAVRRGTQLQPTAFVVRLHDGREVIADADPRPAKLLRKRSFLIGSAVEVELGSSTERAQIVTFSRGL